MGAAEVLNERDLSTVGLCTISIPSASTCVTKRMFSQRIHGEVSSPLGAKRLERESTKKLVTHFLNGLRQLFPARRA